MTTQNTEYPSAPTIAPICLPPVPKRGEAGLNAAQVSPQRKSDSLATATSVKTNDSTVAEWPADHREYLENWNLGVSRVWGINFHQVTMEQTLQLIDDIIRARKPTYAITANLNYAMLCSQSKRLREFTEKAGLVLCDGMPIVWRSRWNKTKLTERVAGSDLIFRLAERSQQKGHRIYLYGAAEGVAEKAACELERLYPGCVIAGYQCPPFRSLSESELRSQIDSIRQAKPDILLIALGQPKGEFWIEDHLNELNVPLCIQLGASFDFVAGTAKRAPKIWQRTGLEWLYRACSDPKRLVPRYLQNAFFLLKSIRKDLIDALDGKS